MTNLISLSTLDYVNALALCEARREKARHREYFHRLCNGHIGGTRTAPTPRMKRFTQIKLFLKKLTGRRLSHA